MTTTIPMPTPKTRAIFERSYLAGREARMTKAEAFGAAVEFIAWSDLGADEADRVCAMLVGGKLSNDVTDADLGFLA